MPLLIQVRIVYPEVAIPDPQGNNPKPCRPFVVITRNDEIHENATIHAVGITSSLDQSPAENLVVLPYGPNARTGLKAKSAALCTWVIDIACDQVAFDRNHVSAVHIAEIIEKVLLLNPPVQSIDDPP